MPRRRCDYFASQGVAVRVISGDNPDTVAAIAREVGLDAPHGFDARELPEDDDDLADVLEREPRLRPGHAAAEEAHRPRAEGARRTWWR